MLGGVFQLGWYLLSETGNLGTVNHTDTKLLEYIELVKANTWPTCN